MPLFVRLPPSLHGNNNGGNGGSGSRSHARRGRRLFHGAVSLTDLFPTLVAFAAGAGVRADSGGGAAAAAAAAAAAKVLPKAFDAAAIDGEDLSGVLLRAYGNHGGRDSKSGKNRRSSSSGGGDGDEGGEENNGNEKAMSEEAEERLHETGWMREDIRARMYESESMRVGTGERMYEGECRKKNVFIVLRSLK